MPTYPFNNRATTDNYSDDNTCLFPIGRKSFSLQVYNAAIYYHLWMWLPPNNYQEEPTGHFLAPSLGVFSNPQAEGLPEGALFGGIQVRSAVGSTPALVTVI